MSSLASASVAARAEPRAATRSLALIALTAILLVAAGVRLWALTSVGFNNDEAVYAGQGAALAADPTYSQLFAIFRAHPLLVQFLVSLLYRLFGVGDVTPRLLAIGFGVAAVALVYATGKLLFNARVGLIAAAILAVMPYHVIVTRQVLLDGPETTLFLLTIYLLARYVRHDGDRWLYGAAFAGGLTVLAKETAILLVGVVIVFALLSPDFRLSPRRLLVSALLFVFAFSPYPAAILIGKGTNAAQAFLLWQILRQPNHTWTFYAEVLPPAMGGLVFIAAADGVLVALRRRLWEDRLLISWIAVPFAFFELWPVKGFQYLLPTAPAVALLAAVAFERLWTAVAADAPLLRRIVPRATLRQRARVGTVLVSAVLAVVLVSVAIPTAQAVGTTTMQGSLAGTGGLPGARDTGLWIRENVPPGAAFLTIGPTMGNIVEFYGQRQAWALSVSPNPLRRNPAYDPISNPDRAIQLNQIQYIAVDSWSSDRSPFFASLLRRYIDRYHGFLIYQQRAQVRDDAGNVSEQVVIQLYEVRP